ncbi:hypothetical protein R3W88_031154 [Solanum pinnatisectum]|uniref:Uncharacterized protein n=1 Tax=Solanum pinnatisectum TaxID=50273 RepID=A0AAV9LPC0_9SOLN|nr:hypothetical protein R3W88_031154 [Solanum pinnatisectum]
MGVFQRRKRKRRGKWCLRRRVRRERKRVAMGVQRGDIGSGWGFQKKEKERGGGDSRIKKEVVQVGLRAGGVVGCEEDEGAGSTKSWGW